MGTAFATKDLGIKLANDLGDTCPGFPEKLYKVPSNPGDKVELLKPYREARICLYLLVRSANGERSKNHLIFFQQRVPVHVEQRCALVPCVCGQCAEHNKRCGDDSMLVGVVEFSENPEHIIVRGTGDSFVRLFPLYERCLERGYTFYHSARSGSIPAPGFEDGKLESSLFLEIKTGFVQKHDLMNEMVKTRSQVVQGLPGQQDDIDIELEAGVSDCGKRYGGTPFLRFFIDSDGVWFTLCKLVKVPIQVVDYGFGPFNFEADSF